MIEDWTGLEGSGSGGPSKESSEISAETVDLVVIGGGASGMAAALEARRQGIQNILILERDHSLGGILNQCVHDGFGLEVFGEALTGPEYMDRFISQINELSIEYLTDCMVLELNENRTIVAATPSGLRTIRAGAVILAMGCRERTRGAIRIPGSRPAGVYTAGTAQNFINLQNLMVGHNIVILGSGDIGMIMARRLTLEGANVLAIAEILPYASGLPRNVLQCLEDYEIPLLLSHTITNIIGKERVEAVELSEVDQDFNPIKGSQQIMKCDTVLLSVGLIPENELSRGADITIDPATGGAIVDHNLMTSVSGIFSCGNVLHVHDVVDFATIEAEHAGRSAARFLKGTCDARQRIALTAGPGIRYVLPHTITPDQMEDGITLSLRVMEPGRNTRIGVFGLINEQSDNNHNNKPFKGNEGNIPDPAGVGTHPHPTNDGNPPLDESIISKVFIRTNPAEMIRLKIGKEKLGKLEGIKALEVRILD